MGGVDALPFSKHALPRSLGAALKLQPAVARGLLPYLELPAKELVSPDSAATQEGCSHLLYSVAKAPPAEEGSSWVLPCPAPGASATDLSMHRQLSDHLTSFASPLVVEGLCLCLAPVDPHWCLLTECIPPTLTFPVVHSACLLAAGTPVHAPAASLSFS